jgi:hypothetical protein
LAVGQRVIDACQSLLVNLVHMDGQAW